MLNGVFAGLLTLLPIGFPTAFAPPLDPAGCSPCRRLWRRMSQFRWRDHPQIRSGPLRVDFVAKFQWDARDPGDDPSTSTTSRSIACASGSRASCSIACSSPSSGN